MDSDIREFGEFKPGVDYMVRPGSYGLVLNDEHRLLVIETPSGLHLPGGGREGTESSEENLLREMKEECDLEAEEVFLLISAAQYLHAAGEGYFKKVCDYYLVETLSSPSDTEENHRIRWMCLNDAASQLSHESHQYAVQLAIKHFDK